MNNNEEIFENSENVSNLFKLIKSGCVFAQIE